MKPIIEINGLGKKYRIRKAEPYLALRDVITNSFKNIFQKKRTESKTDFWALQDINLKIEKGERIGIIGKNGAGKSTLLKILSRVTWPTTGEAIIRGRLASLLEVGTGFHPELTGRENIYLNGSILGLKKLEIDKQFDAIVDFSGVETFLDTPLKNYSSGMQLRLAFAVAAHLEPDVLLIDEVLAVGDMEFQKKCIGKMEEVSKQNGRTILFVSHQLNFVKKLCTGCVWLEKGELKQTGTVNEIIEYYTNSMNNEQGIAHYTRIADSSDYYFCDIQLLTPQINIGGDVEICIDFNKKYRNKRLILNINVLDEADEMISHIINEDDSFSTENANNKIWINLKELNLKPGRYFLSCWAGYDMYHGIDWVEKAVSFEILEVNTLTHRMAAFPSDSKIIIRSKWQAD
jgi:lipopolysaccharide transport system ATP-binding protein